MGPISRSILSLAMLAVSAITAVSAQELELLSEESGGFLELEGESVLEVNGFRGQVNVHLGKSGELRFAAREIADNKVERSVALWVDESTLVLMPIEGDEERPLRIDVSVPPELRARINLSHAELDLAGLHDRVVVRGEKLDIIGRSLSAHVELDLTDSTVSIKSIADGLEIEGEGIDGFFQSVSGDVEIAVEGGTLEFDRVMGELTGEAEDSSLILDNVKRQIRIDASGETVSVGGCETGAELRLSGAALDMQQTKGGITVQTDAEVRFRDHDGTLKITSRGGDVYGTIAKSGALEIETSDGIVKLDGIESNTMISGDGLEIEVKNPEGELTVNSRSSTVSVEKASKSVTVQNDYGDVEVTGADAKVRVFNTNGEVRLDGLKGPVEVKAQGPSVDVVWIAHTGVEASLVENIGGDVSIRFPSNLRARFDVEAPRGLIDTDLVDVVISDDGHYASGLLRGGQGAAPQLKVPTIRAKSAGDLYIYTTSIGGGD